MGRASRFVGFPVESVCIHIKAKERYIRCLVQKCYFTFFAAVTTVICLQN